MNQKKIWLYAYRKLWRYDTKIYAVGNIKLWAPVSLQQFMYFGVTLLVSMCINSMFPWYQEIPFILKWIVFPFLVVKLLDSVKLDGKNPIAFFFGCIRFWIFNKGIAIEQFREAGSKRGRFNMEWKIGTVQPQEICQKPFHMRWKLIR